MAKAGSDTTTPPKAARTRYTVDSDSAPGRYSLQTIVTKNNLLVSFAFGRNSLFLTTPSIASTIRKSWKTGADDRRLGVHVSKPLC